jgi:hypothetical protein
MPRIRPPGDARSNGITHTDVIAVADDMGLETFALGGMSEGGPAVLTTAATRTPAGDGRHASSTISKLPGQRAEHRPCEVLGRVTMQPLVRRNGTMVAAPVQGDVDCRRGRIACTAYRRRGLGLATAYDK